MPLNLFSWWRVGVEVVSANSPVRKMDNSLKDCAARNPLARHVAVQRSPADLHLCRKSNGANAILSKIGAKLHSSLLHQNGERLSSENHHHGPVTSHQFDDTCPVPNRIREIRERLGLTQEQLAERVGTSGQQISRLEKGQRGLDQGWMTKIAAELGVRPAALIDEIADPASALSGESKFAQNEEEMWLLRAWRALDKREQRIMKGALHGLAAAIPDDDPT